MVLHSRRSPWWALHRVESDGRVVLSCAIHCSGHGDRYMVECSIVEHIGVVMVGLEEDRAYTLVDLSVKLVCHSCDEILCLALAPRACIADNPVIHYAL